MKEIQHQVTVRMSPAEKKQLAELTLKTGLSINQFVLNLIAEKSKTDELKSEIAGLKDSLNLVVNGINQLNENSTKQAKAISAMVEVFRAKGLV